MIPIFEHMTSKTLLKRMTHGRTQNQNEFLNSTIWARCTKTAFMGKERNEAAVGSTVGKVNVVAQNHIVVRNLLWVDISLVTINGVRQKDQKRLKSAAKSATQRAIADRRKRKEERLTNRRQIKQTEGARYGAGIAD